MGGVEGKKKRIRRVAAVFTRRSGGLESITFFNYIFYFIWAPLKNIYWTPAGSWVCTSPEVEKIFGTILIRALDRNLAKSASAAPVGEQRVNSGHVSNCYSRRQRP
jgi:hypothetical protein